jgi:SPP1 gp7 family putative phage head morphogenesis protein
MDDLPASVTLKIKREVTRIIKDVYAGNITAGDIDSKLLKHIGTALESQVTAGFGQTFAQVDFDTPDAAMLTRLTRDTWQFAAAKDYQQLRDMSLLLKDETGKLRSFEDFRDAAKLDDEKYRRWLRTEYNQAVGASTMAARWNDFEKNADIMPYLQYDTVGDNNVRDEHQLLDGIVKKITDRFWDRYYPPNGWGCRCSVNQIASSYAKETEEIPDVRIPKMFETNLAKTGLVYPKGHPYYNGIPQNTLRKAIHYLPPDAAYKDIYTAENGRVKMHLLHGTKEMKDNIMISKILADNNCNVDLLPILGQKDDKIRKMIYGTDDFIKGKNPDSLTNNRLFELKLAGTSNTSVRNAIRRAGKQANKMVLKLRTNFNDKMKNVIKGQLNHNKNILELWIIDDNNKLFIYNRKDFGL